MTQVPQIEPSALQPAAGPHADSAFDHPRNILRLRRCPECDYDLKTLPPRHRCPECGFEYDESMFTLYGWPQRERWSAVGRLLLGTRFERALAVMVLLFLTGIAAFQVYRFWKTGRYSGVFFALLFVGAIVEVFRLRPHIRRSRDEQWGTVQMFFTLTGVSLRRGPGKARLVPWEHVSRLRFRRFRHHEARKPLWRLRIIKPFWRFSVHPIEALIECTPREAALIRGEIRRRLQAARTVL